VNRGSIQVPAGIVTELAEAYQELGSSCSHTSVPRRAWGAMCDGTCSGEKKAAHRVEKAERAVIDYMLTKLREQGRL
jgi:hypothetical protein